jgi:hypothetical protein
MNASELVHKYKAPRPRTDTVVNAQYMVEVAFACAARASLGADVGNGERVPSEAADALLELARWMAYLDSAMPVIVEPPAMGRAPVFGTPLATVPRPERGVAWVGGVQDVYRLWLVTHIRVTPLEPVVGAWPDDLPIVDNSGAAFPTESLSGFKCRAALSALIARLEREFDEILADDGDLWSWSDDDPAEWHPEVLIEAVRAMRRQLLHGSAAKNPAAGAASECSS